MKLTYDDYVHFPDDGKRHEIIDGEHFVTPTPIRKHQAISGNLFGLIWVYLQRHRIGRVFSAPFDVILSEHNVVQPDIIYVSHERAADIETTPWVRGAPTLIVEIGSPSTRRRDETIKCRLHERFGVQEYWVVDPELDVIRVFRLVDGRYERIEERSAEHDDALKTPLLPGQEMLLAKIFED